MEMFIETDLQAYIDELNRHFRVQGKRRWAEGIVGFDVQQSFSGKLLFGSDGQPIALPLDATGAIDASGESLSLQVVPHYSQEFLRSHELPPQENLAMHGIYLTVSRIGPGPRLHVIYQDRGASAGWWSAWLKHCEQLWPSKTLSAPNDYAKSESHAIDDLIQGVQRACEALGWRIDFIQDRSEYSVRVGVQGPKPHRFSSWIKLKWYNDQLDWLIEEVDSSAPRADPAFYMVFCDAVDRQLEQVVRKYGKDPALLGPHREWESVNAGGDDQALWPEVGAASAAEAVSGESTGSMLKAMPPRRRRGVRPTPNADKRGVVEEWLQVQDAETQDRYAVRKGIGTSTLREWIGQYERGELAAN